jgi:hypothetical protein
VRRSTRSGTSPPPRGCPRAEKILIPVLDILQSVPFRGFLSVTVTAFINLSPGSILQALRATADGTLRERFFLDLIRHGYSETEARRQLDTAIDRGRYAELFDYHNGELLLEPDGQPAT